MATLILSAPSGLPHGRHIGAHLIMVEGTDATGEPASGVTAFVFAKSSVCKRLNGRR
jgi:hypothetical protein